MLVSLLRERKIFPTSEGEDSENYLLHCLTCLHYWNKAFANSAVWNLIFSTLSAIKQSFSNT